MGARHARQAGVRTRRSGGFRRQRLERGPCRIPAQMVLMSCRGARHDLVLGLMERAAVAVGALDWEERQGAHRRQAQVGEAGDCVPSEVNGVEFNVS